MSGRRGRPAGSRYDKCYRLRMEPENYERLREIADATGMPASKIIRLLIEDFTTKFPLEEFIENEK